VQEGRWAGRACRGLWSSVVGHVATRLRSADLLRLSDNQLYSGRTVWHGQSNLYYKASQFLPSTPLHHFTLTRLVNLDHHAAHSATHHQIHIPHTMHRVCAPRACPEFFTGADRRAEDRGRTSEGREWGGVLPPQGFPPVSALGISCPETIISIVDYHAAIGGGAIPPCPQSTLLLLITLESSGEASAPVCL